MNLARLFKSLALLLFSFLCIEATSFVAHLVLEKKTPSLSEFAKTRKDILVPPELSAEQQLFKLPTVIHPYLGTVQNPDAFEGKAQHTGYQVNQYGFFDDDEPIQKRKDDSIIIGVLGGSVAWWMSSLGSQGMIGELKKNPLFADKKFNFVRLALGANKQPQQLMILNYLLSLGAEFNIVINLDGFNEVALPPTTNLPKGIMPFFPNYWSQITARFVDSSTQENIGELYSLKNNRQNAARIVENSLLKRSYSTNLIWSLYDKLLSNKLGKLRLAQTSQETKTLPYFVRGPNLKFKSREELFSSIADNWKLSSLQIDSICKANSIEYFHFLQPNQYVPNSKPMGEAEKKLALEASSHYRPQVVEGYPKLIEAGEELKSKGVRFTDLTMIYKNTSESTYIDTCCHIAAGANYELGKLIGKSIAKTLALEK